MLPYWLLFFVPAFAALSERSSDPGRKGIKLSWVFAWSFLTALIGLRYQVGGDWGNYVRNFYGASGLIFSEVLLHGDPGYSLLNWMVAQAGYDIIPVNVVCGAVFAWGTYCIF